MSTLRNLAEAVIRRLPPRLQPMARWRFIKFGLVGGSGTVINIAVLYVAQEYLLRGIADFHSRLNYSIALAITLATLSNFYWNRRLTWRDPSGDVTSACMTRRSPLWTATTPSGSSQPPPRPDTTARSASKQAAVFTSLIARRTPAVSASSRRDSIATMPWPGAGTQSSCESRTRREE